MTIGRALRFWKRWRERKGAWERDLDAEIQTHLSLEAEENIQLGLPSEEAEDAAQATFLSALRALERGVVPRMEANWLFTIARNLRIDAIRRERRPELDPEDFLPEAAPAADDGLAMAEDEARLRAALKDLSAEQIQVVELSFFADKPHSQIAAELDIPLGTVKSRLRLAMSRLKRMLGEME